MHLSSLIRQKSYEKVVFVLRRHPVTFIPPTIMFLVLVSVPVAVFFLISTLYPGFVETSVLFPLSVLLGSTYLLAIVLIYFTVFIEWYLDIWIVTNDRVLDVEQLNLFSRTISELDLFRIQDVTTNVKGFFSTMFNYGDVEIKTASQNIDIVFHQVPDPNHVRQEILRLAHIDQKYHYVAPHDATGT